jgi:hypothetical protein
VDWKRFKENQSCGFEVDKKNRKSQFYFEDRNTNHYNGGYGKYIHKCIIDHIRMNHQMENILRFNTREFLKCQGIGVSTFLLREYKVPMSDGLMRFIIKARNGVHFTPERKLDILRIDEGQCSCNQIGILKCMLSCCIQRAHLITKRHNNVAKIIAEAVETTN